MSEQMQAVRTIDMIEMEIRVLQDQTQRVVLGYAIETGRRLEEAKAMLEHGQWGDWVRKMGYSQSTANNLMRVFREYGASQQSLFGGEANSQALGNLSLTKAIRLLALPDQEEREKFVAEHDVENMSTRELEKALKERDEALRRAEEAGKGEAAALKKANSAEEARAKMEQDVKAANAILNGRETVLKRYQSERDELQKELDNLKARPVEVAVETREPTPEELEKLTAQAVEEARSADREKIASMEKQLAAADGDVAAFRVHYEAWQEHYNMMMGYFALLSNRNYEKIEGIRDAILKAVGRMVMR